MERRSRQAALIDVRRGRDRYETQHNGITSRHCFSSGAHYDPQNVAFGTLITTDEHLIEPGAGFERHPHRGVEIVSWVLEGVLRHEDSTGHRTLVEPGVVQYQSAGSGIVHRETNASLENPLRLIQMMLLSDVDEPAYGMAPPPLPAKAGEFSVVTGEATLIAPKVFGFVTAGQFAIGADDLGAGDSFRADEPVPIVGSGELLVWRLIDEQITGRGG